LYRHEVMSFIDKLSSGYFPGVWVLKAFNTQTPGKYPEDNLSLLQHGESLKTRMSFIAHFSY